MIAHEFTSPKADGTNDTLVQPSDWNALHLISRTALAINTNLADTHGYIAATGGAGGITLTLPTAVGRTGRAYLIKKVDSGAGAVMLATTSGQTIDGFPSYALVQQQQFVWVISNGANWEIIGAN